MNQKESIILSDYQRIVSYLYEYTHGIKGANVGFAKIEKRQKQLKLYFHVKTNDKALEYKIYFYQFRHGTMEGTLLDTIKRNDTIIEFKSTYPLVIELDNVDGFLIYHSNEHFFGSEWKDHPIIIRNFLPMEQSSKHESPKESSTEVKTSMPEKPSTEIKKSDSEKIETKAEQPLPENPEIETESPTSQDSDTNTEISIDESEKDIIDSQSLPETKDVPESSKDSSKEITSKLVEYIEALQLEKEAKEQENPCGDPGFDWKEYPTLPLPDTYCLSPSIKIQLEDLEKIPYLPKDISTNGFLLLNYGNYGHLCLAWSQKHNCCYLGVPGIFDNEKSFISKLFGFREFITVPVTPHKTGNFGYFILPV